MTCDNTDSAGTQVGLLQIRLQRVARPYHLPQQAFLRSDQEE